MELHRAIIQGRLLFGNAKSFGKAKKMYIYRSENYHNNDIIFDPDIIFQDDGFIMDIPRYVNEIYEKKFKNTISLLDYCAQFALSGFIHGWLLNSGRILNFKKIEPESDKIVVQQYQKGKSLIEDETKLKEAVTALSEAIKGYEKHALAYERRAKISYIWQKYEDALVDYNKSILYDDSNPHAFYGRAKVYFMQGKYKEAIVDFDKTTKLSVALMSIYWKGRRLLGESHLRMNEWEKSEFNFRLFVKRDFSKDPKNEYWRSWSFYKFGLTLNAQEKYAEAIEAFKSSLELFREYQDITKAEIIRNLAIAQMESGKSGYKSNLKEAYNLGDDEAGKILKQLK